MKTFYVSDPGRPFDPDSLVRDCIEAGAESVLLAETSLPTHFFDLSSGMLGELLHRLSMYRIPLAILITDPTRYSDNFQAFLSEANQGNAVRSFKFKDDAVKWLEAKVKERRRME